MLPKRILKLVENSCRTFLWTGSVAISKRALVSWENVCQSRAAGGLNVLNMFRWNKAAVMKQLWALANKKDCLWVKWVRIFYMKQESLDNFEIPKNATWVVRKIIESRKMFLNINSLHGEVVGRLRTAVSGNKFLIKKMYTSLTPTLPKMHWTSHNSWLSTPTHSFYGWLCTRDCLQ